MSEEYAERLQSLSDEAFVEEVERVVWLSAFAANNPRSKYHAQCDATHDEAKRRGKTWLYQKGWNQAYESCGYILSDSDRAASRPEKEPTP